METFALASKSREQTTKYVIYISRATPARSRAQCRQCTVQLVVVVNTARCHPHVASKSANRPPRTPQIYASMVNEDAEPNAPSDPTNWTEENDTEHTERHSSPFGEGGSEPSGNSDAPIDPPHVSVAGVSSNANANGRFHITSTDLPFEGFEKPSHIYPLSRRGVHVSSTLGREVTNLQSPPITLDLKPSAKLPPTFSASAPSSCETMVSGRNLKICRTCSVTAEGNRRTFKTSEKTEVLMDDPTNGEHKHGEDNDNDNAGCTFKCAVGGRRCDSSSGRLPHRGWQPLEGHSQSKH